MQSDERVQALLNQFTSLMLHTQANTVMAIEEGKNQIIRSPNLVSELMAGDPDVEDETSWRKVTGRALVASRSGVLGEPSTGAQMVGSGSDSQPQPPITTSPGVSARVLSEAGVASSSSSHAATALSSTAEGTEVPTREGNATPLYA